jgi:hypothetical protein
MLRFFIVTFQYDKTKQKKMKIKIYVIKVVSS